MVAKIEVSLYAFGEGRVHCTLRPPSIFCTAAEVAEADWLHSEAEKNNEEEQGYSDACECEVVRTVKHNCNGMEFEARFGFSFPKGRIC